MLTSLKKDQNNSQHFHYFNYTFCFKVTIEATTPCRVLVLRRRDLEVAFETVPSLRMLIDCLVGKDIAKKLYATSDNVGSIKNGFKIRSSRKNLLGNMLNFRRTASADAINTGAKGWVRSDEWVDATNAKELIRDTGWLECISHFTLF